jgi:hypothetical protein
LYQQLLIICGSYQVNCIQVIQQQIEFTHNYATYVKQQTLQHNSKKQTFMVRDLFHCCTKLSARTSFHVIKLWNGFPVSLSHVMKDERCVDIPKHTIWCGFTPETATQVTHLQKMGWITDLNASTVKLITLNLEIFELFSLSDTFKLNYSASTFYADFKYVNF